MTTTTRTAAPRNRSDATPQGSTVDFALATGPTDEHLMGLSRLAGRVCYTPSSVINIIDAEHQHQVAAIGTDPMVCSIGDSMCAQILPDRELVVVDDASLDPRFWDNPFVTGRLDNVRFYASAPLLSSTGHALGTLCVFDTVRRSLSEEQRDSLQVLADQVVEVLELRRRTRWLDLALSELTRSNAVLTDFTGRLSHDLKTPLTGVLGFAEVLEALPSVDEDPRAVRYVSRIIRSGERMRVLIDELLSFAGAGGRTTVTPVDLRPLVDDVTDDLAELVRRNGATVTASDVTLMADPVQLRALLQNLVANALKYGLSHDADGTTHGRVEVRAQSVGTGWVLQVVDRGAGIPEDQRIRVLEPLTRLDRDAQHAGSGIGLATCRRIAQAHGGTLELGHTPGGGTTVTVTVLA